MKKIAISIIVVVIVVLVATIQLLPSPYNLTYPKYRTLEYKDKELHFTIYKYDPPYIPSYFLKNKEEQNLSTPEGTKLAVTCSAGRDKEWYKALVTENYQKKLIEWYKEKGKNLFNEKRKDEPHTFHEPRGRYIYKIEFMQDGNKYAEILEEWPITFEGKKDTITGYTSYIQKGNVWLRDNIPWFYPSVILDNHGYDANKGYDELLKKSKPAKVSLVERFKRWVEYTKAKMLYLKLKRKNVA